MQAIILAGGFGKRLQGVVSDVPKPMAPIGKKPFLGMLIEHLYNQGIREVVLSVHYMREHLEEFFKNNYEGVKISYAVEDSPLGTGGAIVNSVKVLKPKKPFFVLNGDTFVKVDFEKMYQQHLDKASSLTIALRKVDNCSRYGEVLVNEKGLITDFLYSGNNAEGYINAGIYVMNPDLFAKYHLNRAFAFERDFLYPYTPEIKPRAFIADDYFIDIGIPEDYKKACEELPSLLG